MNNITFDKSFYWGDQTSLQYDTAPRNVMVGLQDSYHYSGEVELYGGKYVEIDPGQGYKGWTNWSHKFQPDVRFGAISDKNAYCQQFPEVRSPWKFTEYVFKGTSAGTAIIEPPLFSPKTLKVINGVENAEANDALYEEKRKCGVLRRVSATYLVESLSKLSIEPIKSQMRNGHSVRIIGSQDVRVIKDVTKIPAETAFYKFNYQADSTMPGNIIETELEELYEPLCMYRTKYIKGTDIKTIKAGTPNPGRAYKQEDLETGMIDGKQYLKWTAIDAHPEYSNTFIKQEVYGFRKKLVYPKANSGVRFYRKDIQAQSVDRGQHGNIPKNFINMSAPREWMEPSNIFRNVVTPKVTAVLGTPMYAVDDGIISFEATTIGGDSRASVQKITSWGPVTIPPSGVEFVKPIVETHKIQQPRPGNIGKVSAVGGGLPGAIRCTRNESILDGSYIHKGCSFFQGDETSCGCTITAKPSGVFVPVWCSHYEVTQEDGKETKTPKQFYTGLGGVCEFYTPTGSREIISFETTASTQEEYTQAFSGIKNTGGYLVNGDQAMAMSRMPFANTMLLGGLLLSQSNMLNSLPANPVQMGEYNVRYKVEYVFQKMLAEGRKNRRDMQPSKSDYETIVEGTGKMAFDSIDTGYGGIDSDLFSGTNLLSRHRFNCSIMPCYNPEKCNKAYGTIKMSKGWLFDTYSGVGTEDYCRYYNSDCPNSKVSRRAFEYDQNYKKIRDAIIPQFRMFGLPSFAGLSEHKIADGVFAAIGFNLSMEWVEKISMFPQAGSNIYFYYTVSSTDLVNHTKSLVFAHIKQYDSDTNQLKVKLKSEDNPGGTYPESISWLVQLHDDYVSPSKFETYIDNVRPFMGGRMPEYKDYSKMGDEVQCPMLIGGLGIFGREGNSGTDNKDDYSDNAKVSRGYRVDKTGEFILDGRLLGGIVEPLDEGARTKGKPSIKNGATPIDGTLSTSMKSAQGAEGARVRNAWVFSSDTRATIASMATLTDGGDPPKPVPPKTPPAGLMPTERSYYLCPKCNISIDSKNLYTGATKDSINSWGEPVVLQIVTDLESVYFDGKCPRCEEALTGPFFWTSFPDTRAAGIVNVWGFPGQEVRLDGYYWKNHTEISRSFISEALTKLGPVKTAGGGYHLTKQSSANQTTEESVCLPVKQKGMNVKAGVLKDGALDESTLLNYARNDKHITESVPAHQKDSSRLIGGEYNDGIISPYDSKTNGLDMFTAGHMKSFRNMMEPIFAYPMGEAPEGSDFFNMKQPSNKDRFGTLIQKKFQGKRSGVNSIILASTETGGEGNYVQFWDGTVMPGKCVRFWYPTSKVWWYRYQFIGGISRSGGTDGGQFDNAKSGNRAGGIDGYVGDVYSNSYHFPHGWIPLDKEVVRVIVTSTPVSLPSAPAVGKVWSGVCFNQHYEAFPNNPNEDASWQTITDSDIDTRSIGFTQEPYVSYMYDKKFPFYETAPVLQFTESSFGFNFDQNGFLTWGGYGTDIVQNKTEAESWKVQTYEQMNDKLNEFTMNGQFITGESSSDRGVLEDFSIMPPVMTNEYLNNKNQYIPNYFNFNGMNDMLIYDKDGPEMEIKVYDTSWAYDDHQAIRQKKQAKPESFDIQTDNGPLSSGSSKFGQPYAQDITEFFKKIYNKRNSRAFKVSTGMKYEDIAQNIVHEKINAYKNAADYKPKQSVNDRYSNPNGCGFWLNNYNNYPQKVEGDFPTIIDGEEYLMKPSDIVDTVSGFYISPSGVSIPPSGTTTIVKTTRYNDFNPLVLCMAKTDTSPWSNLSGWVPSTTGEWNQIEMTPVSPSGWIAAGESKYWMEYTQSQDPQYFSFNISGFPTEKERRPYRYESGHWNVANARCPNISGCRVATRGLTVAEFMSWAESPAAYGGFRVVKPSLEATHCAECGADLTKKPEQTGAMYIGGDGITTITYGELPSSECFINSLIIAQKKDLECSFSVQYKNNSSNNWKSLISIRWIKETSKWEIPIYSNGLITYSQQESIPILRGKWMNGSPVNNTADEYNFLAVRSNKVKYECTPVQRDVYYNTDVNGAAITTLMANENKYIININCNSLKDDELSGSYYECANDFSSNDIEKYLIRSNTSNSITLQSVVNQEAPKTKYRIHRKPYVGTCTRFEVYGLETTPSSVKITGDCSSVNLPLPEEMRTSPNSSFPIVVPEIPSRIVSLSAGSRGCIRFAMTEKDDYSSLSWKIRKNGSVYDIYGGEFFFDNTVRYIYMPTKCIDESGNEFLFKEGVVDPDTIPTFLEMNYFTGNGIEITMSATSVGNGPSYLLEKDSIRFIYKNEPDGNVDSDIDAQMKSSGASISNVSILPEIGKSIIFNNTIDGAKISHREELKWRVTNPSRCVGSFSDLKFVGNELNGPGAWQQSDFDKLLSGGSGSEKKNGFTNSKHMLSGKVGVDVVFSGLPNTIISGDLYVYAKSITTDNIKIRTPESSKTITTYERTGGIDRTGFMCGLKSLTNKSGGKEGRRGICCTKPKVYVYLRERNMTDTLE